MSQIFTRALSQLRADKPGAPGEPIRFIASTSDVARDGLVIESDGWDLRNYQLNPVFLWAHDYTGTRPPIGRAEAQVEKGRLICDVVFDQEDEFARAVESKYRRGFLSAVSVGWETKEMKPPKGSGSPRISKAELLDISAVPVPADPHALAEIQRAGLRTLQQDLAEMLGTTAEDVDYEAVEDEPRAAPVAQAQIAAETSTTVGTYAPIHRAAIPPHTTPKAPEGTAWDAGAQLKQADGREQLRKMSAWVDEGGDPDAKGSYKLPHHLASGDVVWNGVSAAMARLFQSNTQIPDSDRKGVYAHLVRHYKQFGKEPPEFRTVEELRVLGPEEILGFFLEHEPELHPDLFRASEAQQPVSITGIWLRHFDNAMEVLVELDGMWLRVVREVLGSPDDIVSTIVEPLGIRAGTPDEITVDDGERMFGVRAGAVLNARNRDLLAKAIDNIQSVIESAKPQEDSTAAHAAQVEQQETEQLSALLEAMQNFTPSTNQ